MPYQTFEAADGALVIAIGNDEQWQRLCDALELEALRDDPRLSRNPGRVLHRADVVGEIARRLASGTRDQWLERLRAARVPAGAVRDVDEVVRDPALAARGAVLSATVGTGERASLIGLPWRLSGGRPGVRLAPPRLGQHTGEFLARFGS